MIQTGSTELTCGLSKAVNTTEQSNINRTCEHNTAPDKVKNTGNHLKAKLEDGARKGKEKCTVTQEQKKE